MELYNLTSGPYLQINSLNYEKFILLQVPHFKSLPNLQSVPKEDLCNNPLILQHIFMDIFLQEE